MKTKQLYWPVLFLFLLSTACTQQTDQETAEEVKATDTTKEGTAREKVTIPRFPSPAATVSQTVGLSTIKIDYSRPSVISPLGVDRTGKIWGRLVPYNFNFRPTMGGGQARPWRAGANENTVIEISHDARVEGQPLKAGKYGVHMAIHKEGGATVIFSNTSDAWGSFSYDQAHDALRVEARTEEIPLQKRLIYTVTEVNKTSGVVSLDWENKRISFKLLFDTHGMVLADFRNYLSDTTGLTWKDFNTAATYSADNNISLEEGLQWIEKSIAYETNYSNLSTKSRLLASQGKEDEALELKKEALTLPTTTPSDYYSYGTQLVMVGDLNTAMKIFNELQQKWPDHWLTAHGLARGNSALGNYLKAIEYEVDAITKAPNANKGYIEWAISKLENGEDFN